MKITIKLDYACRIMAELAREYSTGLPVRIDHLSKVESVPANFLAQILGELRNGRLVVSKRGIQGGFTLARPPDQITLHDIIGVIEGDLLELSGNHFGRTGRRLKQAWQEIRDVISEKTRNYTLETLAANREADMYHI